MKAASIIPLYRSCDREKFCIKKTELTFGTPFNKFGRFTFLILICWVATFTIVHAETTLTKYKTLRLGVLPDTAPEIITNRFSPLLHYLERENGLNISLIIPKNYRELVNQFQKKEIDMAFFGGYTFVMTQYETKAEPLVMRDIGLYFSTVFLVPSNSTWQNLEDFKGGRFGFGAKLSTSGHVMPRYFLHERGIDPENYFSEVRYSGGHDITEYWVRDGQVDLGAANSKVIKGMIRNGRLSENDVRILWETPAYTNYVFSIRSDFNEKLRAQLFDSFLALSPNNPEHQEILSTFGAKSFIPVHDGDFGVLRRAVKTILPLNNR